MHGTVYSNMAINEADLLLAFGVRFDDRVTGKLSEFAKHGRIVHVDIDASEINKNKTAHIAVNSDVKTTLAMLNPIVEAGDYREWHQQVDAWRESRPDDLLRSRRRDPAPVRHRRVLEDRQGRVPDDDGRRPAPDVRRPVDEVRQAEGLGHLRRPRLDGLRPPRRDGRPGRLPRRPGRGHRRRRQLRHEHPGTRHRQVREPARSR